MNCRVTQPARYSSMHWIRRAAIIGMLGTMSGVVAASPLMGQQRLATGDRQKNEKRALDALLARPVTIDLDRVSLKAALDTISQVAQVLLQYKTPILQAHPGLVILHVSHLSLGRVLEQLFDGTTLHVVSDGATDLAVVDGTEGTATDSVPQFGTITGRVVDSATGRGLSGAAVKVAGSKISVSTSDSGRFVLRNVPAGDQILSIKLFGFRPTDRGVTIAGGQQYNVRILLVAAPNVLSGVVTTATGVQARAAIGNDITVLNADSLRRVAPINSVSDLLESRVPGLTVLRSSGTPGDPTRLRLRGPGSINGNNDPIVIVDGVRMYGAQSDQRTSNTATSKVNTTAGILGLGVTPNYAAPSPIDQIDPNSIETIAVLKGPSASSMYGSDAANGVIVITTKHGRAGPTTWSSQLSDGMSFYPGEYPVQTVRWGSNSHEGGFNELFGLENTAGICDITSPFCNVFDSVTHIQLLNLPYWSPVRHGNTAKGTVTISGGIPTLTYSLTGSGSSDLGYLYLPDALSDAFVAAHGYAPPGWARRPDHYNTWGGSGQLTSQPKPGMQVTLTSQLRHGLQQRSSLERMLPLLQGTVDTNVIGTYNDVGVRYANAYERVTDEQLLFNNALKVSWAPWSWLPVTGTAGINVMTGHDVDLLPRNIVPYGRLDGEGVNDTLGHYSVSQKNSTVRTLDANTTIPGLRGRLRTAIGFNMYAQSTNDLTSSQDTLLLGVTVPERLAGITQQSTSNTTTFGWFLEPRLSVSERFFMTPGFRLDGGTANGDNASVSGLPAKLTFASLFPKVNFSYIALNREPGDRPAFGGLTLLRPRVALGSAGVQPTPGEKLRLLSGTCNHNPCDDTLNLSTLGNTHLRPERSLEIEGGFEADWWHGRATLTATRARKVQHDAIISVPLAPSVFGEANINLNVGEVRNTSTELSGSAELVSNAQMRWAVGGNFTRNDNIVTRLDRQSLALVQGDRGGSITSGSNEIYRSRIVVGYPLFGRWDRSILGYADANGDGVIQPSEIRVGDTAVFLGRQDPASIAAFYSDLALFQGRLQLHAEFSHQGAYSQLNAAANAGTFLSVANDPNATLGQQASYVAATGIPILTQEGVAQTVTSWRFQTFSILYSLPQRVARRFGVPYMSVSLLGSNLALWTNYRGKDPNVNAYPNGNVTADGGQLPQPRTWLLQFNLGN